MAPLKISATLKADLIDTRAKLHQLIKKFETLFEARKQKRSGATTGQRAASLLFVAQTLKKGLAKATNSVETLLADAKSTPRPATPLHRDPLFHRPPGAPVSEYEMQTQAHANVLRRCEGMQQETKVFKERVVTFRDRVRELRKAHVLAKKMGKTEHDIESLGNASENLHTMVDRLEGLVGEATNVAMERR